MKKLLLFLLLLTLSYSSDLFAQGTVIVKDSIVGNVKWTQDKTYLIQGFLYVVDGATLTIEPGTLVLGDQATKGTLIVERGGKIIAQGTAQKPIVMTSANPPGQRNAGDWGGLIICGRAPINVNNTLNGGTVQGGETQIEGGPRSKYGGTDPHDNSGIISYVRIEFSGIALSPNNETNSLTLGGVGDGTQIDHVQVSYGGDDGYEWFGGTVNAKYLVNLASLDDDWDNDFGWSGKVQFGVSLRDPNVADISTSNGFESDNNNPPTFANPRTSGRFCNMTLVGPQSDTSAPFNALYGRGAHIRRNSQMGLYNSIIMGWPGVLLLDGTGVTNGASNDTVQIRSVIMAGLRPGRDYTTNSGNPFNVKQWVSDPSFNNQGFTQPSDVMLKDPFNITKPDFTPLPNSPAATSGNFTYARLQDAFFTPTNYIGAFDPNGPRWDAGWTEYDPKNAVYSANGKAVVAEVVFPTTTVGQSKDSALIMLRNDGFQALTISNVLVTGAQFSVQGLTTPFTILGKDSKTIMVRYTPNDSNQHTGTIAFAISGSGQNITVTLKGKGKVSSPVLTTDYSSLDFSLVRVNESVDQSFTITNTGTADLQLSNFTVTGTNASLFSFVSGNTDGSLAPNAKRTVVVKFSPNAVGDFNANITFKHNAPANSTKQIPVKGKGIIVFGQDVLQDSIVGNVTLTNDRIWLVRGFVYVVDGATLNIEPGTVIFGEKATKGTLIVERGGKIYAEGTPQQPIVMTSQLEPGQRTNGDWGGLILCGRAPINVNNSINGGTFVGGETQIEGGPRSKYGGNIPDDSSGVLRYVRVEFSGIALSPNNETNGITFGGIGNKTVIDHCQVSYGGDDAYEWFGGTVNAKYLIAQAALDDDWDTDFGWSGKVQFGFSLRHPDIADISGSNGFESDNNNPPTFANPRTSARFSNMTVIGPQSDTSATFNSLYRNGAHIRRNSQQGIYNSIIAGWPGSVLMDGTGVTNGAAADTVQMRNNIYAGLRPGRDFTTNSGNTFNTKTWLSTPSYGNSFFIQPSEVQLTAAFNINNPDPRPKSGSPALSGADFTNQRLSDPFFTPVTYRGAFGSERWDSLWANYDAPNTVYAPNQSAASTQIDFGQVVVGTQDDSTFTALIRNTGNVVAKVTEMSIVGSSEFEITAPQAPFTVLARHNKNIALRFKPNATGARSAKLHLKFAVGDPIDIDIVGQGIEMGVNSERTANGIILNQNMPNPAAEQTTFTFSLPKQSHIQLLIMDVTGRHVATVVNGVYGIGEHTASYSTYGLPNGTYIYRLVSEYGTIVRSMVVLR